MDEDDALIHRQRHMDEDDNMVHDHLVRESMGRTNRIRVSMGEISIEIESNNSPRVSQATPRVISRYSPSRSNGANSRRATGGEVPSTPGSSPITKFKTESSRGEESFMEDIYGEHLLREELIPMDIDQQPFPDEQFDPREEDIRAFGPDDLDDFTVPNLELTPSPRRIDDGTTQLPTPPKFLTNLDDWVLSKANRYDVDPQLIWWVLERTTGSPKLAIKTLKSFRKHNGTPLLSRGLMVRTSGCSRGVDY